MNLQIGKRKLMNQPNLVTVIRIEAVLDGGQVQVSWPKGRNKPGRWVTTVDPMHLLDITQKPRRPRPQDDNAYDYIPLWSDIPALYSNETTPLAEQVVYIKLFAPSFTWYLTEFSEVAPDGYPWLAFGYVRNEAEPDFSEWGYVPIDELRDLHCPPFGLPIERDLYWESAPFGKLRF
ncbi:MAG: hypothetical protein HY862_03660 [Chloroflexi bacterium]|nr:hypothetical protein [Chloroflexota bacterium]